MTTIQDFLSTRHPYDQMSDQSFEMLVQAIEPRSYVEKQKIYSLGEAMEGIYIVRSGMVEVSDTLGEVISVLGVGNSFGERGLFRDGEAVTNAYAAEACELLLIPAELAKTLMAEDASFRRFFDRQRQSKRFVQARAPSTLSTRPVSELMNAPVITVAPDLSVTEAAQLMSERKISCLIVAEDDGAMAGIFTLRDLTFKVLAQERDPQTPVREIMTENPVSIESNAIVSDALLKMARLRINHLPVTEKGALVGILTKTDLLAREAMSSMSAVLEISRANDIATIKLAVEKLPLILSKHAGAGTAPHIITKLLTDIADAATRRLIELFTLENGEAPAPYVWAACGSQGRQEQTGVSDQDNCIIHADGVADTSWYDALAKYVSDGLDAVGYFYCPGDMMATNPKWCQPVSVWRDYFEGWIKKPTGEAQMLASVMFDLRAIDGDARLLEDMRAGVLQSASENSIFLGFLISNSLDHQPPLSLFRGFATIRSGEHKNTVDLKHNGVVPITDLARVYAIMGQVSEVNTRRRLELAHEAGALSARGAEDLIAAYDYISELRLRHQMRQIREDIPPDNFLDPSQLSELERSHLRDAFVLVKSMQSAISRRSMG